MQPALTFTRLTAVPLDLIADHMSDPRVAEHMPLLTGPWDAAMAAKFVAAKEATWTRDGLGHWAIWEDGQYLGWGGLQKEGEDWDLGLVLRPDAFGHGPRVIRRILTYAKQDPKISAITFLLPPSRKNLGALTRLGAAFVGLIDYDGASFRKYRLETA